MEAYLNINKNGDYYVYLTNEEILELDLGHRIFGPLHFDKDGTRELHTLTLVFVKKEKVEAIRERARTLNHNLRSFMHTLTVVQNDLAHIAYFLKEEWSINDTFREHVGGRMWEHRYDDQLMRKIFLICQT